MNKLDTYNNWFACLQTDCKAWNVKFPNSCSALETVKYGGVGCPFFKTFEQYQQEVKKMKNGEKA